VKEEIRSRKAGHTHNRAYQAHRFKGVSTEELQSQIGHFARILGRFDQVKAEPVGEHVFRIAT
jgi:hypothetical protein